MQDGHSQQALLISGTVGAGKTTAAEAVGEQLRRLEIPHAVIDLDWLRACWPSPPGDPFNNALELANLGFVADTYLCAGAGRLVLAGVLEGDGLRVSYQQAVRVPLQVAWLRNDLSVIDSRLRRRHEGQPAALDWHLARAVELEEILRRGGGEDFVLDATGLSPEQTAVALMEGAGWTAGDVLA